METLATVAYKELKNSGAFLLPGFAKFVVIKKPATKERAGINPFTKEPTPQNDQLMSERRILCLKPTLRLEWRGQDSQDEAEQC